MDRFIGESAKILLGIPQLHVTVMRKRQAQKDVSTLQVALILAIVPF
jgi:hypothetical protein